MILKINGKSIDEIKPFDKKVVDIEAWYDRHTRSWVIELLNKDGYQIGNAVYVATKEDKNSEVKWLKEQYNL